MVKDLIVIGAGNPDIIRIVEDINSEKKIYNFIGFLEKNKKLFNTEFWGYPILGSDELLDKKPFSDSFIVNNVYYNQNVRKMTFEKLKAYENRFCNLIHPSTHYRNIKIGKGNIIADGVIIQSGSKIGDHNMIHSGTIISHETEIGDNCLFSVKVTIGSRSQIGNFCFFGIASCTLPQLQFKDFAFISGGTVVFNNVKENYTVLGNPAKLVPMNQDK